MRNHTTPLIHELSSTGGGKTPTLTPGSTAANAQFMFSSVPNGVPGKFWYYLMAVCLELKFRITQSGGTGVALNPDVLWQVIQSIQIQCPILGTLYSHQNTRGAVLGNIMQPLGFGYNAQHLRTQVAAANGNTDVTLNVRIPFSFENFRKPHETAPWGGFLEGGTLEFKLAPTTVFATISPGSTVTTPCQVRAWCEFIPSPEAVIHVPFNFREHELPGSTTKHVIQDLGSPDGLQGTNQAVGCGVAFLGMLTDATNIGLNGADGTDNILGVDLSTWRPQPRVDNPQAFFSAFTAMKGVRPANKNTAATHDSAGYPYTLAAAVDGQLNDAQALFMPLITPGRDLETSKLQTVMGAKEINFQYTSVPTGAARFVGLYLYTWSEQAAQVLAERIAPGRAGRLVAKTLNKQNGMRYGDGKGAYVRLKVMPAQQ
jgi:hypothetical protein